jgi:hypothetical protein
MISLNAALSITTGLLQDFVICLQSEEAATARLINNFSGKTARITVRAETSENS